MSRALEDRLASLRKQLATVEAIAEPTEGDLRWKVMLEANLERTQAQLAGSSDPWEQGTVILVQIP